MSCEFDKANLSCSCVEKSHKKTPYTGLITHQSTKHKQETSTKYGTRSHPRKTKKLSLKVKKQLKDQIDSQSLDKKFSPTPNPEELNIDWLSKPLKKQTRGWMEKKKLQIQIKSIGRVPTNQLFYPDKPSTKYNPEDKTTGKYNCCVSTPPYPGGEKRKSLRGERSGKEREVYSVIDELAMEEETSEVVGRGQEWLKGEKGRFLETPTTMEKNSYLVSSREKKGKI